MLAGISTTVYQLQYHTTLPWPLAMGIQQIFASYALILSLFGEIVVEAMLLFPLSVFQAPEEVQAPPPPFLFLSGYIVISGREWSSSVTYSKIHLLA